MINSLIPIKYSFPNISNKPESLHSVFNSIRQKKQELERQLTNHGNKDINLPSLMPQNNVLTTDTPPNHTKQQQSKIRKTKTKPSNYSLLQKYRTINQITPSYKKNNPQKVSQFFNNSKVKGKEVVPDEADRLSARNKRIKTEVQKKKNEQNIDQQGLLHEMEEQQSRIQLIQEAKTNFYAVVHTIPKSIKNKNENNLEEALQYLQAFNPFFNRNQRILNICLLKLGRILSVDTCKLYTMGEQLNFFYIVLLGKVKLSNGALRKICQTGQTVLEEIMFETQLKKISLQKAKTLGPTVLLEMKLAQYAKMKEQLIKHGYKIGFLQTQSIIKRNYIVKNWLRNKIKLQSNK